MLPLLLLIAAPPSIQDGLPDRILLKGRILRLSGPIDGEVLVVKKNIRCIGSCASQAAGATVIDTGGIIIPGMIDSHNHAAFNVFDEDDWNPGPIFRNHNQWPRTDARYKEVMAVKKHLEASTGENLSCEMVKYGELKSLIAGTTSALLAPKLTVRPCFGSLARTIDTVYNDLDGADRIQTSISVPDEETAAKICRSMDEGTTKSFVVHVGEGIDETSRKEFDTLASRAGGCLIRKGTTVIHGTAFGSNELKKMAEAGMALVASPKSNLFLYQRSDGKPATTLLDLAIKLGVKPMALGPDWALGGSVNLLDELRFTKRIATENSWTKLTDEKLFRMVTIDAAIALGVDDKLGSITKGKRADLAVISGDTAQPYRAVLESAPKNVSLVMVDGRVLCGDEALKAAAPDSPGCETIDVCGMKKFLCVAEGNTANKLDQTYQQIRTVLSDALARWDAAHPEMKPVAPLAPLARCD